MTHHDNRYGLGNTDAKIGGRRAVPCDKNDKTASAFSTGHITRGNSNAATQSGRSPCKCLSMSRRGVSPVISTTILVAISVVLGLSLWSFSVSESNTASFTITNSTTSYVNYLQDRFTAVHLAYGYVNPADAQANRLCPVESTCATLWIYNHGELPTTINEVLLGEKVSSLAGKQHSPSSLTIPAKSVGILTIQNGPGAEFSDGTSYVIKVVSTTGAFQQFYEKNPE